MHPVEQFKQFVEKNNIVTDEKIKCLREYHLVIDEDDKKFHKLRTGVDVHEIGHFDTLALGYNVTKYIENWEKMFDATQYFESGYAIQLDSEGVLHAADCDGENSTETDLLNQDQNKFVWMIKYWRPEVYEEETNDNGEFIDSIYYDDTFTNYDIVLCRYDSSTVKRILEHFC